MKKLYTHETVTYGSSGRNWVFKAPGYELKTAFKGGAETAHKVARIVAGAVKRSGEMDNLGRANIYTVTHKAKLAVEAAAAFNG